MSDHFTNLDNNTTRPNGRMVIGGKVLRILVLPHWFESWSHIGVATRDRWTHTWSSYLMRPVGRVVKGRDFLAVIKFRGGSIPGTIILISTKNTDKY